MALKQSGHAHRLALAGHSSSELAEQLERFLQGDVKPGISIGRAQQERNPRPVFVFSGHGGQWLGMGRELLQQEPAFRAALERCEKILRAFVDWRLFEELTADAAHSRLDRIDVAQPTLFAIQVGVAALWQSWGIEPAAVVGHSMGEVAAAYVAGALSLVGGMHYYLWLRLVRDPQLPQIWARVLTISIVSLGIAMPGALLAARLLPGSVVRPLIWVAFIWMGVGFLLVAFLGLADLARFAAFVIARFRGPGGPDPARRILLACELGEPYVTVGIQAKALRLFHAVLPGVTARTLALVARLLPAPGGTGPQDAPEPGWQHRPAIARHGPLAWLGNEAARRNREVPWAPPEPA